MKETISKFNRITQTEPAKSTQTGARHYKVGTLLRISRASDSPYRLVTEEGLVNLSTGYTVPFEDADGLMYEPLTVPITITPGA